MNQPDKTKRLALAVVRNALRTSSGESAKPELIAMGARLRRIRAGDRQPERARHLEVHTNTYARWEQGKREMSAGALAALVREGINANWLLTGEGPERLGEFVASERAQVGASQALSDENLTIAIEFAERSVGDGWLPRPLYAKLVRLMYEGVTQGLPVAQVLQLGRRISRQLAQGEGVDDGEPGLGRTG